MEAKATAKYVRVSPRKAGQICDLVRGKNVADKLYVASIVANQGPTMKRFMPRAMGRATMIRKRTSHIEVVLKERK